MKILKILTGIEERVGGFLLFVLFLVVILQIFSRTVGWTIVWTEESSRFLFIWIIFLGVSAGIKYDTHVGTNVFINLLAEKKQKVALLFKDFLFLLFMGYMTKLSFNLLSMQVQFKQHAPATGIPIYFISIALPISFIGTSIRLIFKIMKAVKTSIKEREQCLPAHG